METNLEIKLVKKEYGIFDVEMYEPESGDFVRRSFLYSPGEHPEFNKFIGDEIFDWVEELMND